MSPWMRNWMNTRQDEEQSGYYRTRTKHQPYLFYAWLSIIIAAVLALVSSGHHEADMTEQVNRKEVISRWDGSREDIGTAISRELFNMKQARNSAELIDRMYANK